MYRLRILFQRRVTLALLSALVMGGLSVGVVLVTASSASPTAASSNSSATSSDDGSTETTSSLRTSSSDDDQDSGETGNALSGVVQQVDAATGDFVLRDRRSATWTIVVTPDTQFVGISPSQIQPGQRLRVQGTIQSDGSILAASILAAGDD